MRILQFGQTGQVSRAMIAEAATGTATLVALSRQDVDLTDTGAIRNAIAEADCDLVVNCAGFTLVDRAEAEREAAMAANAAAPAAMALACSLRNLPLIHLSTDCVFDGRLDRPYRETDDPRPLSIYGVSKLEGEAAVLAWEKGVVLRISWVFSRFGRNFIRTMLQLGRSRDVLNIVSDQYGNPTDACALAQFILKTAPRWVSAQAGDPAFGCFHFTNQGSTSRHGLAEAALARDPMTRARILPILKRDFPEPAARPLNGRLDCARLTEVFGWAPAPWRPAVEQATDWILAEGLNP